MDITEADEVKLNKMLNVITSNNFTDHEFEVIFQSKNASTRQNIDQTSFKNLIRRLKALGYELITQPDVLDISYKKTNDKYPSSIRISINDVNNIRKYCSKNDLSILDKNSVIYTIKKPAKDSDNNNILPVKIDNYNLKFNLKYEKTIPQNELRNKNILNHWKSYLKSFRYKKRYSFKNKTSTFRIDLTVVKSSTFSDKRPVYTKTFLESNLLNNKPRYEVEIEFIGNKDSYSVSPTMTPQSPSESPTFYSDMMTNVEPFDEKDFNSSLIKDMFTNIKYVYQALEGSFYITSKEQQNNVMEQYKLLTGNNYFKAPLVVTLEKEQALQHKEYKNIVNIRKNYTVTDKADGERNLLLFLPKDTETCELYLINRQSIVKKLGVTAPINYSNTILDGELITKNKSGETIQLYMVFDIYYLNGTNIMAKPFPERVGRFDETDIYNKDGIIYDQDGILETLFQELPSNLIMEETNLFKIKMKQFYYGDLSPYGDLPPSKKDKTIFDKCNKILSENNLNDSYNIDGLIFTPVYEGVWGDGINKQGRSRWDTSFKWKPPEENSIDFYVKIEKQDGKEKIYNFTNNNELVEYKKCILYVGFDKKQHSKYNSQRIVNERPIYQDGYGNIKFMPVSPYKKETHITYVKIKDNLLFCEDGSQIKDESIIEFRWDGESEHSKWKPLRKRYSKSPNALNTALNVWTSIQYPITKDMITTGKDIKKDTDKYYIRQSKQREELSTYRLQEFHNKYVKTKLIDKVSNEGDTLLDISVGKGGDIHKWKNNKLSFVLGQDISQDGLINHYNGACVRYMKIMNQPDVPTMFFVWGDSSKRISTSDSALDKLNKYYLDILYGHPDKTLIRNNHLKKYYGIGRNKFDIISCQFAIHYFFKNEESFAGLLQNIDDNVKVGGYFIGTCFDGEKVFEKLKDKSKICSEKPKDPSSKNIKSKSKKCTDVWYIKKKYKSESFPDNNTSLGMKINVFIDSINNEIEEYLVNFKYLTKELEKIGFKLENDANFEALFNNLKKDPDYDMTDFDMTDFEKQLSFLYKQFIFQRIKTEASITEASITDISKTFEPETAKTDDSKYETVSINTETHSMEFEKKTKKKKKFGNKLKKRRKKKLKKVVQITEGTGTTIDPKIV
tara:strand:+ start:227 stop:3610 length:3384 start_codon:yes stop_codon:yes gene_type:complete